MTTQTVPALPPRVEEELARYQEVTVGETRSPSDALRAAVFAVVTVVLLVFTLGASDAVLGFETDVVGLLDFSGGALERVLTGVLQIGSALVAMSLLLLAALTHRYRLLAELLVAGVLAGVAVALATWWVDDHFSDLLQDAIDDRGGIASNRYPAGWGIGVLTAMFVVTGPYAARRWRRAGVVTLGVLALSRLVVAVHPPVELFVSLSLSAAIGSLVLFAFGRPDSHPSLAAVRDALTGSGLPIASLEPASVDARGSRPYMARLDNGTEIFAKVVGSDERAADLLFRTYRFLRFQHVGDERPFSSLRRTVEHEALVSLHARDKGVRTPRLQAVVDVGQDSMLLAYDRIDGTALDSVEPARVTDDLLRDIWEQVATLRRHRIAHRDLRRANVFVDGAGAAWIIDFGFSEVAASDDLLDADVAQLVAALAVIVGAERAVDSAIAALGRDGVGRALPRLQLRALSGATQEALRAHKGLLEEVQRTVIDRCAIVAPHYEKLDRVSRRTLLMIVVMVLAVYALLPQFANLPDTITQVKDANWAWLPVLLLLSALTYVGATAALMGSVPARLPAGPTLVAQVATSFTGTLAPASVGGMALNIRFLERSGVDPAMGVSGVGLDAVGGLVVHVVLLVLFVVWAGRDAFGTIDLPDPHLIVYGVAAVIVMAVLVLAIPAVRRLITARLFPILSRSIDGVWGVIRRPEKMALLLIGSTFVTLGYIAALYVSTLAFGGDLTFAGVAVIFLVGSALASAAPTPGGLGALEAALVAGLTAAGMDASAAVPAVFLYRLATFWLPILPGWLSFTWLTRAEYL